MKFRILVNPNAGRQVVLRELHSIYRAFAGEENKNEVVMELTVNSAHAAEALDRAIGARPDTLVCCGGDGTLSATVDRLLKSGEEIKLGYIPAGSTNDFANFLGLPKEPAEAADLIVDGEAKPIDAGEALYIRGLLRGLYPDLLCHHSEPEELLGTFGLYY